MSSPEAANPAASPEVTAAGPKYGEKTKADPEFSGPKIEGRKCTDILFLILFIGFWAGMFALAGIATEKGDPKRLYLPTDLFGMVCGRDNTGLKYPGVPYYANCSLDIGGDACQATTTQWIDDNGYSRDLKSRPYLQFLTLTPQYGGLCVEFCPYYSRDNMFNIPQIQCPPPFASDSTGTQCVFNWKVGYEYFLEQPVYAEIAGYMLGGGFKSYAGDNVFGRCLPLNQTIQLLAQTNLNMTDSLPSILKGDTAVWSGLWGDITRGWRVIVLSSCISLIVAFATIFLLRIVAAPMVWLTVILCICALVGAGGVFYKQGTERKELLESRGLDTKTAVAIQAFGIILLALAGLSILLVIFLSGRIRRSIGIIKETTRAVAAMPLMIFFPIPAFFCFFWFLAYWIAVAIYLISSGTPTAGIYTVSYEWDTEMRNLWFYHLMGGFWTIQLLVAIVITTIAGAVASWYFARDKKAIPSSPVWAACKRALRYHLGSLAFGAFIIALVQTIRAIVTYIQRQAEKTGAANNKVARIVFCVAQCCLAYLQRFLEFLSRNAYIQIAIHGDNFCTAAKNAFFLIMRNVALIAVINTIGDFLLFICKLFIAITTAFIGFELSFQGKLLDDGDQVESPILIASLCFIIGYAIAQLFMNVFEAGVDTVLQCFVLDTEMNEDGAEPFCTNELRAFMKEHHEKSEEAKTKKGCCH